MIAIEVGRGGSVMDALADALFGDGRDGKTMHEEGIEHMIHDEEVLDHFGLVPRRAVKIVESNDNVYYIQVDNQPKQDPHTWFMIKHPEREDRWRLYNLCPRSKKGTTMYKLKGLYAVAYHRANLAITLALNVDGSVYKLIEFLKTRKKPEAGDDDDD